MLLLDKPAGISSNARAAAGASACSRAEKAGHTGTLDPLATGLLPLCFGEATKFAQALLDARKATRATLRFGTTTTTGDAEGEVTAERAGGVRRRRAATARSQRFTGAIEQVPPRYSALKHEGRPLLRLRARRHRGAARAARRSRSTRLQLVDWTAPDAVVDVACSKGTYVRTLAEDIGERLGCGAHLAALRRTGDRRRSSLADALDVRRARPRRTRRSATRTLLPVDALLAALPTVELDAACGRGAAPGPHGARRPGCRRRSVPRLLRRDVRRARCKLLAGALQVTPPARGRDAPPASRGAGRPRLALPVGTRFLSYNLEAHPRAQNSASRAKEIQPMAVTVQDKAKVIADHQRATGDTGSPEVQVALLTARINGLTDHFKDHVKDHHSRRGLLRMVSRRRKLLDYLKSRNADSYRALIEKLGLRK